MEIRDLIAGERGCRGRRTPSPAVVRLVIAQIAIIDIVFSLDSVITAVGMASSTSR